MEKDTASDVSYIPEIKRTISNKENQEPVDPMAEHLIADATSRVKHRNIYSIIFSILLILQLLIMNVVFILHGCGVLKFEEWTLRLFLSGTLLQVFAICKIIVKYLFSKDDDLFKPHS